MSEKYIAKKYVAVGSVTEQTIKCPNCHRQVAITVGGLMRCLNNKCKLGGVYYREVKSLTTIERIDAGR